MTKQESIDWMHSGIHESHVRIVKLIALAIISASASAWATLTIGEELSTIKICEAVMRNRERETE